MVQKIREFIENNVKKGLIKRDLFICEGIDNFCLDPLAKVWSEYGIRKRDIILLSIIMAHKYADLMNKDDIIDCGKVTKNSKPVDMGRLSDFTDTELTFLISILISKHGVDKVVNNIGEIWEGLRVMAEKGIWILYYKIYKEKTINTELFNTILNLDEEFKI